jgi:tRNA threonylcarbamoyladenosine dehydratase
VIEVLEPVRDRPRISSLLDPAAGIRLVDAWKAALPELASLDLPHLSPGTADAKASLGEYLAAVWTEAAIEAASRYVLYPWRSTIVRLPDADLFWRLRTARNRYLIDEDEQRAWSAALIGIAGLSVGASVLAACSLTGARRFRLAEADTLGPTNLNRLAGSVCDFGEPKLTLAMRRTLEADPYSDLEAFAEGYTPRVADAFIGTGGTERLTVLVEEMDDLALKVDIRLKARAARVPVVMITDNGDNAILDVERFDLDAGYPLFHGLAGDLAANPADLNDPVQRVHVASAIVGSQITPRTRFSLTQVGRTLPSWPQLGTAATAGGALGALAARYVACGVPLPSGRYRVDLDEILLGAGAHSVSRWNELDEAEFLAGLKAVYGT